MMQLLSAKPAFSGPGARASLTFAYHRSLGPMVGVILALACAEAFVVHIIAMAWLGWQVAMAIGVVDLSVVMALIWLLRSFRRYPIVIDDTCLVMRTGARLCISVPLADVVGFRASWTAADIKAPHVFNMALASWPNVVIDLRHPILRRGKAITVIAHCVDDPAAFRNAIVAVVPGLAVG